MPVRAFGASAFDLRMRRDSHGGPAAAQQAPPCRSDKCLSRARIVRRHYAIDLNTYNPPTRREARGSDAPFKFKGLSLSALMSARTRARRTFAKVRKQGAAM